ncbi:glycosyltransferase [Taibaiella soli]|nr:glycosyltransferase [Taibaiella soli]
MTKLLKQVPRILQTVNKEHQWLQEQAKIHHFDGIISDNRYGLFHETIPSVIITHQLQVQTGLGNAVDSLLRPQHYRFLNRFSECWIPDVNKTANLSGSLGHPKSLPANVRYLGLLSQFEPPFQTSEAHILILLSGPEPQRSMLAEKIWEQLDQISQPVIFIAGSDAAAKPKEIPAHVQYFGRLSQRDLQPLLEKASLVICRSGYSSLMDIAALGKKAVLIPTPGQTEQEYLAKELFRSGQFLHSTQNDFDLKKCLLQTQNFRFDARFSIRDFTQYRVVLDTWLHRL